MASEAIDIQREKFGSESAAITESIFSIQATERGIVAVGAGLQKYSPLAVWWTSVHSFPLVSLAELKFR